MPQDVPCQYQVMPAGGAPRVMVTFPHWGELLVGVAGVAMLPLTVIWTLWKLLLSNVSFTSSSSLSTQKNSQ